MVSAKVSLRIAVARRYAQSYHTNLFDSNNVVLFFSSFRAIACFRNDAYQTRKPVDFERLVRCHQNVLKPRSTDL